MSKRRDHLSWMQNKDKVITLSNVSRRNFILELPTGRCRLDAGRVLQTVASVTASPAIKALIDKGDLVVKT